MSSGLSSVKSTRCKPSAVVRCLLAASETRVNQGSSLNDLWLRRLISSGVNHQLESRMQEICQSGSEGGARITFVPTPIRSTSITKQLVFQYPFCRKTSCNRVLERFLLVE